MNDLLKLRWMRMAGSIVGCIRATVEAELSITGALWSAKGRADILKSVHIEAPLHRQELITDFGQGPADHLHAQRSYPRTARRSGRST